MPGKKLKFNFTVQNNLITLLLFYFYMIFSRESSPAEEEVILATAGYDHCIKFWMAHTG